MKTKQTAVEWLLKELEEQKLIKLDKLSTILFNKNFATRYELIVQQALAMEKEQMIDMVYQIKHYTYFPEYTNHTQDQLVDKYYNETYGK